MSFYGNIKKVDSSVFTFDRRYSSRVAMDNAANNDGVYVGRYVLIEYGERFLKKQINISNILSNNNSSYNRIMLVGENENYDQNQQYIILTKETINEDQERALSASLFTGDTAAFNAARQAKTLYKLKDNAVIDSLTVVSADNQIIIKATIESLEFRTNADIDLEAYGAVYDSTVWQKVYVNNENKYIMVAELNAKVPKIELNLQDALIYSQIGDGEAEDELYAFNAKQDGVYRLINTKETAIQPSFNTNLDTELSYILNQPSSLNLKVDNKYIDFNKKGFNTVYSYGEKDGDNVISWVGEDLRVSPTGKRNSDNEILATLTNDQQKVGTKVLFMNVPIIGNTINQLYDLLFGETSEDKTYGGIRPFFKEFRPTDTTHNHALQAKDKNGKLVNITINGEKCMVEGIEGEPVVNYEVPSALLFDNNKLKSSLTILPDTITIKHKVDNNTYEDLSGENPNGNVFCYQKDGTPVELVIPSLNGETDDLSWISNVPTIKEILGNNTYGLASILRNLFGYADPISGVTKFYFYTDWLAVDHTNDNQPCIANKPKVVGGYPISFTYNQYRKEPENTVYEYITATMDDTKSYTDGHYFIDYNSWQLTSSPSSNQLLLLIQKQKFTQNRIEVIDPEIYPYPFPDNNNYDSYIKNQNACSVYQLDNEVYILVSLNELETYQFNLSSNKNDISAEARWLLLDIATGLNTIDDKGIKINENDLEYNENTADLFDLEPGHILYAMNFPEEGTLNQTYTLTFSATDFNNKDIIVHIRTFNS